MTDIMTASSATNTSPPMLAIEQPTDDTLTLRLTGTWQLDQPLPALGEVRGTLSTDATLRKLTFNTQGLNQWDSGLMTFLLKVVHLAQVKHVQVDFSGLPEGARSLLRLSTAVAQRKDAAKTAVRESILTRIGGWSLEVNRSVKVWLAFIGDAVVAVFKLITGRANFRFSDLLLVIQECGAEALPIVTLISILIGLILAFVGAVQLALFGAQIYVANLVAIAMLREMGAMMTGIIMAGRTGAAFAAQLGTMQVNEEIDALQTLGIQPMEFLVLPRMVALVLMMPLLCIYADLLGIIGGAIVGVGAFDVTLVQYFEQSRSSMQLNHFLIGIGKSVVFGAVIALSGCLRGMQCGRSATAVGYAATSAVVTAIVAIIALDGLFAVMTNALGI